YYAEQAIVDREAKIIGHEIFYRNSVDRHRYPRGISSVESTSELVLDRFLSLDNQLRNDKSELIFINFSYESLLAKLPILFDKSKLVIEILEDCKPNKKLLSLVEMYHSEGYKIALDDFTYTDDWEQFLTYVDFVKLDIRNNTIQDLIDTIENIKVKQKKQSLKFIAEKIETKEELDFCLSMDFSFFQGHFFDQGTLYSSNCLDISGLTIT
ncbi:EAL domain-containing protein, partial [Vibrio cholerae]|nr:EAL domain-containing protein [Vibrio cholerae]